MSDHLAIYALGAMGFLAWKAWGDARAGRGTLIFPALAACLFWPVVWPIMAGQMLGAARRKGAKFDAE